MIYRYNAEKKKGNRKKEKNKKKEREKERDTGKAFVSLCSLIC